MVGKALMDLVTMGPATTLAVGAAGVGSGRGIMRLNKRKDL